MNINKILIQPMKKIGIAGLSFVFLAQTSVFAATIDSIEKKVSDKKYIEDTIKNYSKENKVNIEVILSDRKLFLYKDSKLIKEYPVAVGKKIEYTKVGDYKILEIKKNPSWCPPYSGWVSKKIRRAARENGKCIPYGHPLNPLGSYKFRIYGAVLIHGNGDKTVGTFASHGCIRMREKDINELANYM